MRKAARLDADWRELGTLELKHKVGPGIGMYARAHNLLLVFGTKLASDCFFSGCAYVFGVAIAWVWGVRA